MHTIHLVKGRPGTPRPPQTEAEIAGQIHLISSCALFAGLKPAAYRDLVSCARQRIFSRGETVFLQGHPIREHVLLQSGMVKVTQVGSSGIELLLWMHGPGQQVGIPNNAPHCWHACSARAVHKCRTLTWEDSCFQALIAKHPQIGMNINRLLALQLGDLEQRFREVTTETVPMRLSFALLRLADQLGTPASDGVEISLSREELAQMISSTVFTVSRILSKWEKQGFVAPRHRAVIVLDSGRLMLAGVETAKISA
jgi:CRP-like cAMP-binding protein